MQQKDWSDLANGPIDISEIDDLEALAKAHEGMAYRYRSAISLLRWRLQTEEMRQPASAGLAERATDDVR